MKKAKVVIKEKKYNDENDLIYVSKCKGNEGTCYTMAIGFAVSLAKENNISLTKVKELVTDIYKETEDIK